MAICATCGNDYDKSFEVTFGGQSYTFDSFECAIHALAAHRRALRLPIIGHGVEADGRMFCCAKQAGVQQVADRT